MKRTFKVNPEHQVYLNQCLMFSKQEKYQKAREELDYILKVDKNNYDVTYLYGDLYFYEDLFDKALEWFEKCIKLNKNNPDAYIKIINIYKDTYKPDLAQKYLDDLKVIVDNPFLLQKFQANILIIRNKFEEAFEIFNSLLKSVNKKEEKEEIIGGIITCLAKINAFDKANTYIQEGLKENPNNKTFIKFDILLLLSARKYQEALKQLKSVGLLFQKDKEQKFYKYVEICCYYNLKKFEDVLAIAQPIIEEISDKEPNKIYKYDYYSILFVALTYYKLSQEQKFKYYLDIYKQFKKYKTEEYLFEMARISFIQKNYEECQNYLQEVLERSPNYYPAIVLQRNLFIFMGDIDSAKTLTFSRLPTIKNYPTESRIALETEFHESGLSGQHNDDIISLSYSQFSRTINSNFTDPTIEPKVPPEREILGKGGFGIVYKENLCGVIVATKELKFNENITIQQKEKIKNEFTREIQNMVNLNHENVIKMRGFFDENKIFMEYAEGGDLQKLNLNNNLSINLKVDLSIGVAKGLQYLHSKKVIHGDLKGKNILLDKKYDPNQPYVKLTPKICDFGLSIICKKAGEIVNAVGYTPNYAAPEALNGSCNEKADIYSYGLVLYELFTKKTPFHGMDGKLVIAKVGTQQCQPDFEKDLTKDICPSEIKDLIKHCCKINPEERPNADEIISYLSQILNKL